MSPYDIQTILDTMVILVDRREQPTDRARKRYTTFSAPYRYATLDYGDYAANYTLPSGKLMYGENRRVRADVVIERKMNLDELAGCFTHGRERFRREFERAAANGARVYLLVENASWENLLNGKYRSKFNPKAFKASITAYMARYGMQVIMCKEETSGKLINEILYRELKERLSKE